MKNTKHALIAACIMVCIGIVLPAYGIVLLEQELLTRLEPLKEEGMDKMHAVQSIIVPFHIHMAFDLAVSVYFLIVAGLLIFAIRRLPNPN